MNKSFILDFDTFKDLPKNKMQLTNTYIINGKVKLFSNMIPKNKRNQLHSVDKDVPYRCVSVQLPVDYDKKKDAKLFLNDGNKIYKIFAEKDLNDNNFEKIFENGYEIVTTMPWLAYPKYEENPKQNTMPNIIIDSIERSRVFYSNAIEWSSSCMEICSIQSRNISLLIAQKEKAKVNPKTKRFFQNPLLRDKSFEKQLHKFCGFLTAISFTVFLVAVSLRLFKF